MSSTQFIPEDLSDYNSTTVPMLVYLPQKKLEKAKTFRYTNREQCSKHTNENRNFAMLLIFTNTTLKNELKNKSKIAFCK